jgi:hypothetical protein
MLRFWGTRMSANEVAANIAERRSARGKRPRSAVTSGRKLFIECDSNTAWSRRYFDLCSHHIDDISNGSGRDALSEAQLSLIRRASAIECELERLDACLSRNEPVDMDAYARVASHLRRLFETLGIERKPHDVTPDPLDYAREHAL